MFVPLDVTKADVVEDGTYDAIIGSAEVKTSKKGSQYINWAFDIPEEAIRIYHMTSYDYPKNIKKILDACGAPYGSDGFDLNMCLGKPVRITVVLEDDPEFGFRNRVTKISRP